MNGRQSTYSFRDGELVEYTFGAEACNRKLVPCPETPPVAPVQFYVDIDSPLAARFNSIMATVAKRREQIVAAWLEDNLRRLNTHMRDILDGGNYDEIGAFDTAFEHAMNSGWTIDKNQDGAELVLRNPERCVASRLEIRHLNATGPVGLRQDYE